MKITLVFSSDIMKARKAARKLDCPEHRHLPKSLQEFRGKEAVDGVILCDPADHIKECFEEAGIEVKSPKAKKKAAIEETPSEEAPETEK